eukprot:TRINITY_DN7542_c0_g1_i1.p1 TRINITY_DN7542_c0_g1~~TRINITY_DN7542_c0_g1_i1.p1  ORF type:complete len:790 (+),score=164.51 TRINITY_DN7542_c0_g1_i1:66-2435(+)
MAAAGKLPAWLQVGKNCRYWSESQQTHHPVVVTSVDPVKKRVVVIFVADSSVWKTVPYSAVGPTGVLRPADGAADGKAKENDDGTATPPWYDQLNQAETREQDKEDLKKKTEDSLAQKERRRYLWQQEQQRKADEERKVREEERQAREAAAEVERLRIVEKLRVEREAEQMRQFEVLMMSKEEEVSGKVNAVWRQREAVARRQREEEEREQFEEEQRLLAQKLHEEMANRPRIAFGVTKRQEPTKVLISQQPEKVPPAPAPMPGQHDRSQQPQLLQQQQPQYAAGAAWPAQDSWSVPEAGLPPRPSQAEAPSSESPAAAAAAAASRAAARRLLAESEDRRRNFAGPAFAAYGSQVHSQELQKVSPGDWYGMQIRIIYQKHNPSKLADVPMLLNKYVGCEEEMYERICEKYGVQPIPPPENLEKPASASAAPAPKAAVGYARKAGAAVPPPTLTKPKSKASAPSANSLMERFQNLVGDLDDDYEVAQDEPSPRMGEDDFRHHSRQRSRRRSSRSPRGGSDDHRRSRSDRDRDRDRGVGSDRRGYGRSSLSKRRGSPPASGSGRGSEARRSPSWNAGSDQAGSKDAGYHCSSYHAATSSSSAARFDDGVESTGSRPGGVWSDPPHDEPSRPGRGGGDGSSEGNCWRSQNSYGRTSREGSSGDQPAGAADNGSQRGAADAPAVSRGDGRAVSRGMPGELPIGARTYRGVEGASSRAAKPRGSVRDSLPPRPWKNSGGSRSRSREGCVPWRDHSSSNGAGGSYHADHRSHGDRGGNRDRCGRYDGHYSRSYGY